MNKQEIIIAELQRTIRETLHYWLHGSLTPRHPVRALKWRFSPSPELINKCFQICDINKVQSDHRPLESPRTYHGYAKALATIFYYYRQILSVTSVSRSQPEALDSGTQYEEWIASGGASERYDAVHRIRRDIVKGGHTLFTRAVVHGSVATLEDTLGFSDLDLAFIVRQDVLEDPLSLLKLREFARKTLVNELRFDPNMHHGPHYIPEVELTCYDDQFLPTVVLNNSVDLHPSPQSSIVRLKTSSDTALQNISRIKRKFQVLDQHDFRIRSTYELESILGNVLLLPCLFSEAKLGRGVLKRDSFQTARLFFRSGQWEPVDTASSLRIALSDRSSVPAITYSLASTLRWPGSIQFASRLLTRDQIRLNMAEAALGKSYPHRMLNFIEAMEEHLNR